VKCSSLEGRGRIVTLGALPQVYQFKVVSLLISGLAFDGGKFGVLLWMWKVT